MNRLRFATLAAFALTSALAGQTVETLPRGFATTEGNYSRPQPLRHPPARIQCGYDANATGWKLPKVIHKLTARRDRGAWLNNDFTLQMQVWVSSNGCNPAVASKRFSDNHGRDLRVFMKKKFFSFKKFTPGTGVRPFTIELKGDNSFVAVGNEIVIDWATYSLAVQHNAVFHVDAHVPTRSGSVFGRATYYGNGCNATTAVLGRATGLNQNELFQTSIYTWVLGEPALMWLSPKRADRSIGNGCRIYADFGAPGAIFYPVPRITADFRAQAVFSWGVVPSSMVGKKLWSQGVALTARSGLRWSNGVEASFGNFGPPYVIGHSYVMSGRTKIDPDKADATFCRTGAALIFKVN